MGIGRNQGIQWAVILGPVVGRVAKWGREAKKMIPLSCLLCVAHDLNFEGYANAHCGGICGIVDDVR